MQLIISHGAVDLSGEPILTDINMEINTNSRIAVVGRNGCGKTTLLKLISGEYPLAKGLDTNPTISVSENFNIGILNQMTFSDENRLMVDEIRLAYKDILETKSLLDEAQRNMEENQSEENIKRYSDLLDTFVALGGHYFEREYEGAIKRFGFTEEEKYKRVSEFSGGQRTKIAFLKLLLSKPDLLLLDEPTNHLDINAVTWLEDYIRNYKKAVVIVSHDRMFLDRTVNEVYEIEYGRSYKYIGNYTDFIKQKKERDALLLKQYTAQQKEIEHLSSVVERFRYKATKAAMAQSKIKQIERMEKIEAPIAHNEKTFKANLEPSVRSAKEVLTVKDLQIGFDRVLSTVRFSMLRGERVGIIGGNGLGKSTLLKTLVGKIGALGGEYKLGAMVNVGYFDQQQALYRGNQTVFDNYQSEFPSLSDFEVRSALGAFLFTGEEVFKTLDMLSGGERVRLALCKLFRKNPNFLILDEPTNHMDIASKEALEELLLDFEGTLLFVSHDRYFIKKLANKLLVFEENGVEFKDMTYDEYQLELSQRVTEEPAMQIKEKPQKKTYTTPAKEKAKRERAIKKAEEKIAAIEGEIENQKAELEREENLSDYVKLSEIGEKIEALEAELLEALTEWENLAE
ncbi:MAG: ABC-F family ATP-binding cassette domain-containing protein [Clostridia bacterium]|nr:ABC-F family ATP-binding cassette domain-containing protein [Clostridia bacterium]